MSKAIEEQMLNRAKALLADKTVTRVAGWKKGLFGYDVTPGISQVKPNLIVNLFTINIAVLTFQNTW